MARNTEEIRFRWNGREVSGRADENVAEALFRAGYLALGATRKRHRPLGLSGSYIQGVLANVGGIPNVRLDQIAVAPGLEVTRQNTWPSPQFDLLKLFRFVPQRWVRGGFEHTKLLPSGTWRFAKWERLLAFLAGEGRLSPLARPAAVPGQRLACDTLVIGAGPAGITAANAAARAGKSVILVSRGAKAAGFATAMNAPPPALDANVRFFPAHEACGIYRGGALILAAPLDGGPALSIEAGTLILATGKRSMPPLVRGNTLPGVLEIQAAMGLATRAPKSLGRVVLVGTDARDQVAARLRDLGVDIVASEAIANLRAIDGRSRVSGVDLGRTIACDSVIHAGPWRSDPNLVFQAMSEGQLRLGAQELSQRVQVIGSANDPDEHIHWSGDAHADVCPCMDVTAGEIAELFRAGIRHVEELKRQTSAGMGPCQGFPCWESMNAVIAASGGEALDRPSHRAPRRALTVAQAAGLADLVEPIR